MNMLDQMSEELKERKKNREIQGEASRFSPNAWLKFTEWEEILKGLQKELLLKAFTPTFEEMPQDLRRAIAADIGGMEEDLQDEADAGLARACRATRMLIRQAMSQCRINIVGQSALQYVNRREVGESRNERPFYAEQKVKTLRRYISVWVKILRFIWRMSIVAEENRPKFIMTREQERCLDKMKHLARADRANNREERRAEEQKLEEACLDFWIAMLDHELKAGEHENAIISCIAVLGLETQDGGWMDAMNFTPILLAIVTIARGLVVYAAWVTYDKAITKGLEEGLQKKEAIENAPSIFMQV
jgi:hypothetical protein